MRLFLVSVLVAFMAVFFWKYPRQVIANESEIVIKDMELQEAPHEDAPSLEPTFSESEEPSDLENQNKSPSQEEPTDASH